MMRHLHSLLIKRLTLKIEVDIKDIVDITKVDRQQAYMMYVRGELTRNQLYDFITERTFWLHEQSMPKKPSKETI